MSSKTFGRCVIKHVKSGVYLSSLKRNFYKSARIFAYNKGTFKERLAQDEVKVEFVENNPATTRNAGGEVAVQWDRKSEYPFMSFVKQDKYNYKDSFGSEENWKYEARICYGSIVIFFIYFGIIRESNHIDEMLANPPGMDEVQLKMAIGILKSRGFDVTEELEELENRKVMRQYRLEEKEKADLSKRKKTEPKLNDNKTIESKGQMVVESKEKKNVVNKDEKS